MKTVFNNSELTHIWANQTQEQGRGSNMFFIGDTIYSYGYHFKIAKFTENKFGDKCVFLNCRSYSNTTNKHQSLVWRAIPSNIQFFRVKEFFTDINYSIVAHRENINNYLEQGEKLKNDILKAKKHKLGYLQQLKNVFSTIEKYQLFFDIMDLSELTYAHLNGLSIEERVNNLSKWLGSYTDSNEFKLWEEKKKKADELAEIKALEEAKEKIQKFRDFKVSSIWNLGINLLRYNKETSEIETSGGVKLPKCVFSEAYERFKNNTLLIGQHIGVYRFNGQNDDILQIGCHKIPVNEIENVVALF